MYVSMRYRLKLCSLYRLEPYVRYHMEPYMCYCLEPANMCVCVNV